MIDWLQLICYYADFQTEYSFVTALNYLVCMLYLMINILVDD